jgi:hypothetical protein
MVRYTILVFVLILAACAPTPAPMLVTAPVREVEAPTVETATSPDESVIAPTDKPSDAPWDDPYGEIPPELCPPDMEATEQPTFGPPQKEGEVVVQRGVFANQQGEMFSLVVAGADEASVVEYTSQVRVCLDVVFTPEPAVAEAPVEASGQGGQGLDAGLLMIEIWPMSLVLGGRAERAQDITRALVEMPVDQWEGHLLENEFVIKTADREYMVDFVIDPSICNGCLHQYGERSNKRKAWAKVCVSGGGGSVIEGLCLGGNTVPNSSCTVAKGGTETCVVSHDSGAGNTTTYDLGVRGLAGSNRYRVSGRWNWPGWSAGYYAPAPTGSDFNCNP